MERKEVGTRIKAVLAPDDRINQMQFRANLTLPDYGRVPVCSGLIPEPLPSPGGLHLTSFRMTNIGACSG
jgi:hypothetical protein